MKPLQCEVTFSLTAEPTSVVNTIQYHDLSAWELHESHVGESIVRMVILVPIEGRPITIENVLKVMALHDV